MEAQMEDFARLMEASGVVPIGAQKPQGAPRRPSPPPPRTQAARPATPAVHEDDQPLPTPQVARQAWVSGDTARSALDVALQRVKDGDGSGWAIAILADGSTKPLPTHQGRSALLSLADRLGARLIVVASGPGDTRKPFTYVLHPSQGVATLDNDPEEAA